MSGPGLPLIPCMHKLLNTSNLNFTDNTKDLSPRLKKIIPNASKDFINWLVGFTDAEGFFYISLDTRRTSLNIGFKFSIELHLDDIEVLHKIAQTLGVGGVKLVKNRNSAVFSVYKFEDFVRVILPIFQEFPLQTTKGLDFTSFSEAVQIKLNTESEGSRKRISDSDLIKIQNLKANMNSARITIDKKQIADLTNKISINKW